VDLNQLGERTITLDCDVDSGGRRHTYGFHHRGFRSPWLGNGEAGLKRGRFLPHLFATFVAAVSVGIVEGNILLDLCYEEDSHADVDLNL